MLRPPESAPDREVESLFRDIAPRYDLLNRLLSLGIDRSWRRRAAEEIGDAGDPPKPARILDVAAGTGDLALAFAARFPGARIVALDPVEEMLARAKRKFAKVGRRAHFVLARAEAMPFREQTFGAAGVAFGLRNFADRAAGLREVARVLVAGGCATVLDFAVPEEPVVRRLYLAYFTRVLPAVGRAVSGNRRAYRYLPESVLGWPAPGEVASEAEAAGLFPRRLSLLTGGIAFLLIARRARCEGRLGARATSPRKPGAGEGE